MPRGVKKCRCNNCLECRDDYIVVDGGIKLPIVRLNGFYPWFEHEFRRYEHEGIEVPPPAKHEYCKAIKEARLARGLTQTQMAESIGISRQAITRIEAGVSCSWHKFRCKIEALYGVPNSFDISRQGITKAKQAQEEKRHGA